MYRLSRKIVPRMAAMRSPGPRRHASAFEAYAPARRRAVTAGGGGPGPPSSFAGFRLRARCQLTQRLCVQRGCSAASRGTIAA